MTPPARGLKASTRSFHNTGLVRKQKHNEKSLCKLMAPNDKTANEGLGRNSCQNFTLSDRFRWKLRGSQRLANLHRHPASRAAATAEAAARRSGLHGEGSRIPGTSRQARIRDLLRRLRPTRKRRTAAPKLYGSGRLPFQEIWVPRPGGRCARGEPCRFLRQPEERRRRPLILRMMRTALVVECVSSGAPRYPPSTPHGHFETHAWSLCHTQDACAPRSQCRLAFSKKHPMFCIIFALLGQTASSLQS